jgi:hypothetical protein
VNLGAKVDTGVPFFHQQLEPPVRDPMHQAVSAISQQLRLLAK